jgi:hypothetical protein
LKGISCQVIANIVDNKDINRILNNEGVKVLPVTMVDGVCVKTKTYPTDEEFKLIY